MATFNFGGGCPDPGSVPTRELAEAAARVLPRLNVGLANYPESQGYRPLREVAAARFQRREGVALDADEICLANGSQQPITLFCQALLAPGVSLGVDGAGTAPKAGSLPRSGGGLPPSSTPVIVEEFTYPGTLRAMRHVGATIVGVPVDEEGMQVALLANDLARLQAAGTPPGFIYTTPTYQNPTGSNMSVARRRHLLSLSRQYGVPIVDDNCYGDLDFEGPPPPSIKALDDRKEVILFESFSKIVGPGIRLGYFACDRQRMQQVMGHKIDGGTSVLSAAIMAEYLQEHLADHVATITRIVRGKRDALFDALERHLGDCCTWTHPQGGYFIWIRVPDECDVERLDELAVGAGVAYGTGRAFHYANLAVPYFRLSFAYPSLEEIEAGIETMARCVREATPKRVMVTV